MSDNSVHNEFTLDFQRPERVGMGEAVYCEHKTIDQLRGLIDSLIKNNQHMFFTRLTADVFKALNQSHANVLDYDEVSNTAVYCPHNVQLPHVQHHDVAIVTGGSSDVPVAREAAKALAFSGEGCIEINDVGVAGLWRLQSRLDEIKTKKVVICVAGMDAALPTVLGGLISSVIVAVPSSVGYGVVDGGRTALNSLLCSCAPGLVVVNIDNGYGAACAALRVLNQLAR